MSLFKDGSFLNNRKPRVAVSACLAGRAVRYDGRAKGHLAVQEWLADELDWHPVCPEVRAGLGIPRPPVQLVQLGDDTTPRALGRSDPTLDVSAALLAQADQFIANDVVQENICAIVFKSRSPSCGLASTPVLKKDKRDPDGKTAASERLSDGLFAGRVRARCPQVLLCEESSLSSHSAALVFLFACRIIGERQHPQFGQHYQPLARQLNCSAEELPQHLSHAFTTPQKNAVLKAYVQARLA